MMGSGLCLRCGTAFTRRQLGNDRLKFCSVFCGAQFSNDKRKNTTADQFWAKVSIGAADDCWPWLGTTDTRGYGQIRWRGKMRIAHRIALSLTDGDWDSRLLVCHTCDNPLCCNPAHLWRGTHYDNAHDMIRKGRFKPSKGEANGGAKLTIEQVAAIRASKEATASLVSKFGVATATVQQIRNRRLWKHLP